MTQSSADVFPPTPPAAAPATCPFAAAGSRVIRRINDQIPGPKPVPLLGWRANVLRHFRNPLAAMVEMRQKWGDVVCLVRGGNEPLVLRPLDHPSSTVFAFGAENNRQVLTQPNVFESDAVRAPKECPWLGDNMVAANRQERARQRRTIMPALAGDHLKAYYGDITGLTAAMLDGWRPDTTLNLNDTLEDLTAKIASKTFYGQELDDQAAEGQPEALAALAREVVHLAFSPLARVPINLPGTPYRRLVELTARAETTVVHEIASRRAGGSHGEDVLSMMIRAIDEGNVDLSHNHLVGNAFTLFLAGHDVPANALGFIFLLLAQHPPVAAALLDELDTALGGAPPAYDQLFKLPVLDRVVKESLRVLSPAVIVWRRITSPIALGGHDVPVGTEVILSPYLTHVDPEIYPEPKRFLPERWETAKPSPFEYLPFSYGARKCLGAAFAEVMLRAIVAMVVQRFRLELIPGTKVDLAVTMTMKPKGGLPVVVRRQDREHSRSRAELRGYLCRMVDFG